MQDAVVSAPVFHAPHWLLKFYCASWFTDSHSTPDLARCGGWDSQVGYYVIGVAVFVVLMVLLGVVLSVDQIEVGEPLVWAVLGSLLCALLWPISLPLLVGLTPVALGLGGAALTRKAKSYIENRRYERERALRLVEERYDLPEGDA